MTKRYISPIQIFDSFYSNFLGDFGGGNKRTSLKNNNSSNRTKTNGSSVGSVNGLIPTSGGSMGKLRNDKNLVKKGTNNSFIAVFQRFINSVNTMEATILVPTLLKDISLDDNQWLPSIIAKGNCRQLFDIYCLMKRCKNDFTEVGFGDDKSSEFMLYQVKEGEEEEDVDGEEEDDDDHVVVPVTDHHNMVNTNLNRKQKISLDSGNWSIASDSCIEDDYECDSSSSEILCMDTVVPQLIRTASANLRNLKILFMHLKEVADFVTLRYLDALHLS